MSSCSTRKNWRLFIFCHLAALLLFLSWMFPPTATLWQEFDVALFRWLNGSLSTSPLSQIFWALANVKITDLYGAFFMGTFSLIYVFEDGKESAQKRLAQFFYLCLWGEIGILALKELLFPFLVSIDFLRDSPSLIFKDTIRLSEVAHWLKIKDHSHWSFPSDHAFIALQWAGFITFFCGWRYGTLACLSTIFFILPRLIAGAHWATDALLGSLPLALIVLAWAVATPLYPFSMKYLERFSAFLFRSVSTLYSKFGATHARKSS
ncbi:MAG: phosphatase PAP2 family protein [Verrucomicrobia bacterium]|nr:phosphatase PAP2 family protein [Verrucomicrobiota bacterium]